MTSEALVPRAVLTEILHSCCRLRGLPVREKKGFKERSCHGIIVKPPLNWKKKIVNRAWEPVSCCVVLWCVVAMLGAAVVNK